MSAAPDMTVPIGSAGQGTVAAGAGDAPDRTWAGDGVPTGARETLPWTIVDDREGPLWAHVRGARRTIEVAACTRVGDERHHANQDAAVVQAMPDGSLLVAVLDGITGSVGVDVGQFRRKLVDDFGLLVASGLVRPLELMHRLDREARRWLGRVAPDAATGAAMVVVRIDVDSGRAEWASAGDVRLLAFRAGSRTWFGLSKGGRARVLNASGRAAASGRLAAAVGQRPPLQIEAGAAVLASGELLVLSTDGATAPLDDTCEVLGAYADGDRLAGLEGLVRRLDRLAIELTHGAVDDRTIVALALGRRS